MPPAPRPSVVFCSVGRSAPLRAGAVRSALGVVCVALGAGVAPAQDGPAGERPEPRAMRVPTLSPALEATLQAWYDATRGIEKLEGEHTQVLSDDSFRTETHSVGKFYYEAPDRGRIDLEPRPAREIRARARPGQAPYQVESGSKKLWVCDGQRLMEIDDVKKEVSITPLPEEHRGKNIMNGPLPFLLGMPPELAKRRFRISFPGAQFEPQGNVRSWLADPSSSVMLSVQPLLAQDAANWSRALVELSKPDFLPVRVKLFAPSGESDTVYEFHNLKKNSNGGFLAVIGVKGDPFKPNLAGYTPVTRNVAGGAPGGGAPPQGPGVPPVAAPQTVPAVIGLPHAVAEKVLVGRRYQVKKYPGDKTDTRALVGKVQEQQYPANTQLAAGQVVGLKIWLASEELQKAVRQAAGERPGAK